MTLESTFALLESISHLMGQAAVTVLLLLGIILFLVIVTGAKVRQDRKRHGAPEYVPEHPHISRLASKEEIEALMTRAGMRTKKEESL